MYGARCGAWRLLRILRERGIKCSFFAVVQAIERNPEIAIAAVEDGHEIVSHDYRWIDLQNVPEAQEREYAPGPSRSPAPEGLFRRGFKGAMARLSPAKWNGAASEF